MTQRDRLMESLGRKIIANVKQLADLYDADNHGDDHTPGDPCDLCIVNVLVNTLRVMGKAPRAGIRVGHVMEQRRRLDAGLWNPDESHQHSQYAELRTTLFVEDMKDLVCTLGRARGMDLSGAAATPEMIAELREITYTVAASVLFGLVGTSEEVAEKVLPVFIDMEARERDHNDLDNSRN